MEKIIDLFATYIFDFTLNEIKPISYNIFYAYMFAVIVILAFLFIRNEIYLVRRDIKNVFHLNDDFDIKLQKNYSFGDFIHYNFLMIIMYVFLFIGLMLLFILLFVVVILILLILNVIEGIIILINYWLLIPIILFVLKFILYKVSLRYKK